jgi:hypothetical protein
MTTLSGTKITRTKMLIDIEEIRSQVAFLTKAQSNPVYGDSTRDLLQVLEANITHSVALKLYRPVHSYMVDE